MRFTQTSKFYSRYEADSGLKMVSPTSPPGKFGHLRRCDASALTVVLAGGWLLAAERRARLERVNAEIEPRGIHRTTELNAALLVHSDGPGQGATFTLERPLAPKD